MAWVLRGLRDGVVTTGYPARGDSYATTFPAAVGVRPNAPEADETIESVCPTGAISLSGARVQLDRGQCILCGRCVTTHPETFAWQSGSETARASRRALVVTSTGDQDDAGLAGLRRDLAARVRALRQSVHIRHVDVGSDGSEEWEIQALLNPTYDVHRLGIFFTASPRHADILMLTGAGARAMAGPLQRTLRAMPRPIVVMAIGSDAISGGLVGAGYATDGGVEQTLGGSAAGSNLSDSAAGSDDPLAAVDVWVPGSPPSPFSILHGILLALGRLPARRRFPSMEPQ